MKDIVFLAGGIGITPFYSIIKDYFNKRTDKNIFLFYSNKTKGSVAFSDNLNYLAENWLKLKIVRIFTQELVINNEFNRINFKMLKKYLKNLDKKYYFICGSVGFVTDLWKELKKNKVEEEYIKVESFY
jgi:ferredoxin-NADP reductase